MRGSRLRFLGAGALLALAACATAAPEPGAVGPARPDAVTTPGGFPTPAELGRVAALPLPAPAPGAEALAVEQWDLEGPLPEQLGLVPHPDASPWGQALSALAQRRGGLLQVTEDMHCVARELGRFILAHGARPSDELRTFVVGQCGALTSEVSLASTHGELPEGTTEAQAFAQWQAHYGAELEGWIGPGNRTAGIWFGRAGHRFVSVVVSAPRRLHLAPTPRAPDARGQVRLAGELLVPAARLRGLINQGAFGFAECESDPQVQLPRFALTCQARPGDGAARVEVAAFPAGRIIGPIVLDLVTWPAGRGALHYARPGPSAPAAQGAAPAARLLEQVNAVRGRAGLRPLRLAERESATSTRVAPSYFAAVAGRLEETVADEVVLGLRAGWEVEGEVRAAEFASAALEQSDDPGRLVLATLERPTGRLALLGPEAEALAVGPAPLGSRGLAVVLTAYTLFDDRAATDAAASVLARLAAARAERGLPAPTPMTWVEGSLAQAAASLRRPEQSPAAALQQVLSYSATVGRSVGGFWVQTQGLDFALPQELLGPGPLSVSVVAAHRRVEGEPWGRYVLLLVYARPGQYALRD